MENTENMENIRKILMSLLIEDGVSGDEENMCKTAGKLLEKYGELNFRKNGSIVLTMGERTSAKHIMLDAHIDRIGLIVTYIDENGFIKAAPCGGMDMRVLPSSAVAVLGREKLTGIVCTFPPHLIKNDSGDAVTKDNIWIDTGLHADKVRELIELGDRIVIRSEPKKLLDGRIAAAALDNRAGCAALIRTAELLYGEKLPLRLSIVLSSQEETSELGARTAAFELEPTEAVIVDVGFAKQPGVPKELSGKLGCGGIISIAPVLSKRVTNKLIEISKNLGLDCDFEVDGGTTGTNADVIAGSRGGAACGVFSIPEKYMHTQVEVVSLKDIENTARVLAEYVRNGGAF